MKKSIFFSILTTLVTYCNLYGEDDSNKFHYNYGHRKYGKECLNSIQSNGTVTLAGTEVSGLVQVNGSLKAKNSKINSIQVNGEADLRYCKITDTTIINGSLTAEDTTFENSLSVASQKTVLKMCTIDSLSIREVNGYKGKQIVDLRSGTKVRGSIVVESGNGEIWISPHSKISENQVSGAKIYRK